MVKCDSASIAAKAEAAGFNLRVFGRELPALELALTGAGLCLGVVGGVWGAAMARGVAVRGAGPGPWSGAMAKFSKQPWGGD